MTKKTLCITQTREKFHCQPARVSVIAAYTHNAQVIFGSYNENFN